MPAPAMHSVRSRKGSEENADLQFKSITRNELAKLIADGSDGKVNLSQAGLMLKNIGCLGQIHPSLLASKFAFEGEEDLRVTGPVGDQGVPKKKSDKQKKKEAAKEGRSSCERHYQYGVRVATQALKGLNYAGQAGGQVTAAGTELLKGHVAGLSASGKRNRRSHLLAGGATQPALLDQLDEELEKLDQSDGKQSLSDFAQPAPIDYLEPLTDDAAPATIRDAIMGAKHLSHDVQSWLWESVQERWFLAPASISANNCTAAALAPAVLNLASSLLRDSPEARALGIAQLLAAVHACAQQNIGESAIELYKQYPDTYEEVVPMRSKWAPLALRRDMDGEIMSVKGRATLNLHSPEELLEYEPFYQMILDKTASHFNAEAPSVRQCIKTVQDVGSGCWRLGLTLLEFATHWRLNRLTCPGLEVPRQLTFLRLVVRALQETAASNDDGGRPGVTALLKTLQHYQPKAVRFVLKQAMVWKNLTCDPAVFAMIASVSGSDSDDIELESLLFDQLQKICECEKENTCRSPETNKRPRLAGQSDAVHALLEAGMQEALEADKVDAGMHDENDHLSELYEDWRERSWPADCS